jgi:hypothetical protein
MAFLKKSNNLEQQYLSKLRVVKRWWVARTLKRFPNLNNYYKYCDMTAESQNSRKMDAAIARQ